MNRDENFYPRPPRGGRRQREFMRCPAYEFLSTPSARRATKVGGHGLQVRRISIHALREEGDPFSAVRFWLQKVFLSTPSARRATLAACAALHADAISIHALREEGDTVPSSETTSVEDFYPRPPRGGRLQPVFQGENCCLNFYPRPPRGGRLLRACNEMDAFEFLSTPSARRATALQPSLAGASFYFYPRPPRGGRRKTGRNPGAAVQISIHALREEGDEAPINLIQESIKFLSTPSARRATAKTETKSLFSNKLYNILHEFRRALIYNGSKNYPNHAK